MNKKIQAPGQRSMSAEPQAVTEKLPITKYRGGTPKLPYTDVVKHEFDVASTSTGHDDEHMTPTAKVSAWLETISSTAQVDDEDIDQLSQGPRDAVEVVTTNLGSLHLQPISGDLSSFDSRTGKSNPLQGKAIPPISVSKVLQGVESETIVKNEVTGTHPCKEESNDRNSYLCEDDVCTTLATINSDTSSPLWSCGPADDAERESDKNPETDVIAEVKNDVIITVHEDSETVKDDVASSKLDKIESKPSGVGNLSFGGVANNLLTAVKDDAGINKQDETGSKPSGAGKLSFGGVANTLLQWKLNRARAAKRRSQSIAIDARHFALMGAIADKIKTQLPRSLAYSLKEEVRQILIQTVQAYKGEVGKKHRLTIQAQERLEELTKELEKPH